MVLSKSNLGKTHVLMLLHGDWPHDSRVIKEAEVLIEIGFQVTVLCRRDGLQKNSIEHRNGVEYYCLPPKPSSASPP